MSRLICLITATFCTLCAYSQATIDPVIWAKLQQKPTVSVCVVMAQQPNLQAAYNLQTKLAKGQFVFETLQANARQSQIAVRNLLGDTYTYRAYWAVNTVFLDADAAIIAQLAQLPEVAAIVENGSLTYARPVERTQPDTRGPQAITWGITMMQADQVWGLGYTGQGAVIGGQDTGYDWTHPAIKPRYRGYDANTNTADHNYNWHDAIHQDTAATNPCGADSQQPCDDSSHGTHTMGTMTGLDGENVIGVAPNAKWIGCRNMNQGNGSLQSYVECFEWFIAPTNLAGLNPDPAKSPHVINNSWYCSEGEGCNATNFEVMRIAVANTRAAGIVPIISVGNAGQACGSATGPPGFFAESFSIGATNDQDSIASFSSRGSISIDGSNRIKPNVSAPGVQVLSSTPGGNYASFSGTSMAGPHAAGVVALLISAAPSLAGQVDLIEDILESTAKYCITTQVCNDITGDQIPNNTYGYGRIDALAAVQMAIAVVGTLDQAKNAPVVVAMPNPFDNALGFALRGFEGNTQITLFAIDGRQIAATNITATNVDTARLDTPPLPAGTYIYQIRDHAHVISGKVIKQ